MSAGNSCLARVGQRWTELCQEGSCSWGGRAPQISCPGSRSDGIGVTCLLLFFSISGGWGPEVVLHTLQSPTWPHCRE